MGILRKITASYGMVLTDGETFGKEIYLGVNDRADNWREITDEEYNKILAEQESAMGVDIEYVQ